MLFSWTIHSSGRSYRKVGSFVKSQSHWQDLFWTCSCDQEMDTVANIEQKKELKWIGRLWIFRFPSQDLWGTVVSERDYDFFSQWTSLTSTRSCRIQQGWKCPAVVELQSFLQQGWHSLGSLENPRCGSVTAAITTSWCPVFRADTTGISNIVFPTLQVF